MNEIDAIHLSQSHRLGSANNDLVPGVVIPAYTPGTDPKAWIAQVEAIGLSRLQPANSPLSMFKSIPDTVGSLPGYSGLPNTTIGRKSPEEQQQAVQALVDMITAKAGNDGPGADKFSSGRWIFGNDFGGLQSATLASAAQDERNLEAARNFNLAMQQLRFQQTQAQQQASRLEQNDAWARSQQVNRSRLDLLDRLQQAAQLGFEDQLNVAKVTGQNADAAALTAAGNSAVDRLATASRDWGTAQSAYNARVYQLAQEYNDGQTVPEKQVQVIEGPDGVVRIVPGKMAGASVNSIFESLATSPEGAALQRARDSMMEAQTLQQKVQYTPRSAVTAPAIPKFQNDALLQILEQYGGGVPASTARPVAQPYILGGSGSSTRPAPLAQPYVPQPKATYVDFSDPVVPPDPATFMAYVSGAGDLIGNPNVNTPPRQGYAATGMPPAYVPGWTLGDIASVIGTSSQPVTAAPAAATTMPLIRSKAEFDRLPSGSYYRRADGGTGYKP